MRRIKQYSMLKILYVIFVTLGIVFCMVAAIIYLYNKNFMKTAHMAKAEIIGITYKRNTNDNTIKEVYVRYEIDGKEYENDLNYYSSSMRVGQTINVYYHPDNPYKIITDTMLFPLIFGIIGGAFTLTGLIVLVRNIQKKAKNNKLLDSGQRIYAKITEIIVDYKYSVNRRHPYRILCSYTDSMNTIHVFKSDPLWYDPSETLENNMVPVYVDPSNYNNYYVKVDEVISRNVKIH